MNINISSIHSCRVNKLCGSLQVRVKIGSCGIHFINVNDLGGNIGLSGRESSKLFLSTKREGNTTLIK